MELTIAMGKGKKHREHKMVADFNTDRDIFKGQSFLFKEEMEFGNTTRDIFPNKLGENKHKSRTERLNYTNFSSTEDTETDKKFGDITREIFANELEGTKHKLHPERFKQVEEFAKVSYTTKDTPPGTW